MAAYEYLKNNTPKPAKFLSSKIKSRDANHGNGAKVSKNLRLRKLFFTFFDIFLFVINNCL
jgi:hypothetical protein